MSNKLIRALQWRDDVESGEIIERQHYRHDYMAFPNGVTQKELDTICLAANAFYKVIGSNVRIGNHMGELIPGYEKKP
jgi:hypothetical protein